MYHNGEEVTISYFTIPYLIYHITVVRKCNIIPYRTNVLYHTIPYHAMYQSGEEVQYHTVPVHTIQDHVIPCRRVGRRRRPGKFTSFLTIWIFHSSAFFTLNQPLFCSSPFNHSLLLCFLSPHSQQCSTDVAGFVLTSHTMSCTITVEP